MRGSINALAILSVIALFCINLAVDQFAADPVQWVVACCIAPSIWALDRLFGGRPEFVDDIPRCSECRYDLRATPDRCPECGAVPVGEPTEEFDSTDGRFR